MNTLLVLWLGWVYVMIGWFFYEVGFDSTVRVRSRRFFEVIALWPFFVLSAMIIDAATAAWVWICRRGREC